MKTKFFIISLLLYALGGYLIFSPAYVTGYVLEGIGFMIFIYSIYPSEKEGHIYQDKRQYAKSTYEEQYECGNCRIFGNLGCPRKEQIFHAEPCEQFIGKNL